MEAPLSTSSKLSGASGWTEAAGVVGLPFLRRGCPDSGTTKGSGAVSGPGPDLDPSGVLPPLGLESGRSRSEERRVGKGEESVGSEALFTPDESREPLDESPS